MLQLLSQEMPFTTGFSEAHPQQPVPPHASISEAQTSPRMHPPSERIKSRQGRHRTVWDPPHGHRFQLEIHAIPD